MKYKKIYCDNRVNYTVSKGRDRFIDYVLKPLAVGSIVFLHNFLGRRNSKRPTTIRTKLLCEASREISKKHGDSELTSYFMNNLFWCLSRGFEFDNAYYIRFHETIVLFNEKLEQNGLIKRKK